MERPFRNGWHTRTDLSVVKSLFDDEKGGCAVAVLRGLQTFGSRGLCRSETQWLVRAISIGSLPLAPALQNDSLPTHPAHFVGAVSRFDRQPAIGSSLEVCRLDVDIA